MTAFDGFLAIGVDPGPVPGIVVLHCGDRRVLDVAAFQCTANAAAALLEDLTPTQTQVRVQIEAFVVRRAAAKSGRAGATTRDLVGQLEQALSGWEPGHVTVVKRNAGQVKPWATDARLKAVQVHGTDLLDVVSHVGRHARDAARHALFCAVKDGGLPDPLGRAGTDR